MVYMPLFYVKFPANANMANLYLIDIASFEFIDSDEINENVFVLP